MNEKTAVKPKDRFAIIENAINNIYKHQEDQNLRSIGMGISNKFIKLKSFVLPSPRILTNGNEVVPEAATWKVKKFLKSIDLVNWSVVSFEDPKILPLQQIINALKLLIEALMQKGIARNISQALTIGLKNAQLDKKTDETPPFIICIVNKKSDAQSSIYPIIKRICVTELGVMSQCIIGANMRGNITRWRQICSNLALKINGKLGGVNSSLAEVERNFFDDEKKSQEKFMFFGADIFHPVDYGKRPIVSVVASVNHEATRYAARYSMNQLLRNDTIKELNLMVISLVKEYKKNNDNLPDQIVFYRTEINEGQLFNILDEEILPLEDDLKKLYFYSLKDPPKFTFVTAHKRHHARFVPVNDEDADPNGGNCLPGTVIDTGIVVPQYFTFFLQSHASHLGTARSTYYHVIRNGGNFSRDEMYKLTYKLCFLSARCNIAISHVTPLHYTQYITNQVKHFISYEEIKEPPRVALGRGDGRGGRGRGRGDVPLPPPERPTRVQRNLFNTIVSNDQKIYGQNLVIAQQQQKTAHHHQQNNNNSNNNNNPTTATIIKNKKEIPIQQNS
ncbi:hypothetical protein Glove_87g183 [Diversispora epigaea]|uniref:Piwi domain-containing protein n=1 Tax=Diversispora epigaea TaxID=1348612 RepID=A0A397J708_9GLOM|nr:hypothetical protein Glove_87g183 [Diversispora epigaea]